MDAFNAAAMILAGGLFGVAASWLGAYLCADASGEMFVSSDERVAIAQTESLEAEFVATGIRALNRHGIWRRINWIWKSARVTALSSGHFPAIIGLSILWVLAVILTVKTFFIPRAYDLRILLGGKEFVFYLVTGRRRPKSTKGYPETMA